MQINKLFLRQVKRTVTIMLLFKMNFNPLGWQQTQTQIGAKGLLEKDLLFPMKMKWCNNAIEMLEWRIWSRRDW